MGRRGKKRESLRRLQRKGHRKLLEAHKPSSCSVGWHGIYQAAFAAFDLIGKRPDLKTRLLENTEFFRKGLTRAGFKIKPGFHPIVPVLIGDPIKAKEMAQRLFDEGIYVVAFSYPVVPMGEDRIRVQLSAAHTRSDLEFALERFIKIAKEMGIITC